MTTITEKANLTNVLLFVDNKKRMKRVINIIFLYMLVYICHVYICIQTIWVLEKVMSEKEDSVVVALKVVYWLVKENLPLHKYESQVEPLIHLNYHTQTCCERHNYIQMRQHWKWHAEVTGNLYKEEDRPRLDNVSVHQFACWLEHRHCIPTMLRTANLPIFLTADRRTIL